MSEKKEKDTPTGLEIAVIGMAGRFPGANNINEFWKNLKNGVESISFFSGKELEEAGFSAELVNNPNYVKANGILQDKEYFDSAFFGYSPREAEVMEPQVRLFHVISWQALEDAGYNPSTYKGLIGVYAGSTDSFNWQTRSVLSGKGNVLGDFARSLLDNSNLLTNRISHKLDLRGPSFTVFTACSTSLTAIHLACRALITGECSMALAGGVCITMMQPSGYLYGEGGIFSPDGHLRAFDARAKGTIFGEGAGVVVLKRAKDAISDGDHIYAQVKGSAINNDGMIKVDFTAPGTKGETNVIRSAQKLARVSPESIGYIETHGTATPLGDPIEVSALKKAFSADKKGYCAIGTVKTNIGHLDTAAGVAGFIKTVLALKHRLIPPSLHYQSPNPEIDFENSPFYVNTELRPWKNNEGPLRAGVSSFGIGGSNAHLILEEAPRRTPGKVSQAPKHQLILLSAKTQSALEKMTENLVNFLKENRGNHENPTNPGPTLTDAAYTLQVGRQAFRYRRMLVCAALQEAVSELSSLSGKVHTFRTKTEDPPIIFIFPGQGAQYVNMGLDLYRTEPVFRGEMDRCFNILKGLTDDDIKEILYPLSRSDSSDGYNRSDRSDRSYNSYINQTKIAQPVLFIFEYALARLLMAWGIEPHAMIGHSIGEYTAACISGVFSLESALELVVARGQSMQELPGGSMLSVKIQEDELRSLLTLNRDISLAAVNAPSLCVVSGPYRAMEVFEKQLKEKGYKTSTLHTSHAFHSGMMDPILSKFEEAVKRQRVNEPEIPYISNVTGKIITSGEIADPTYWSRHLRQTVNFSTGIEELLKEEMAIFVEVGPGNSLSSLVKQHIKAHNHKNPGQAVVNLVRHPKENARDDYYLLNGLGNLWLHGKKIEWTGILVGEERYRISLPTYPFEGQRYWFDQGLTGMHIGSPPGDSPLRRKTDMADWFYIPLWEQIPAVSQASQRSSCDYNWLLFLDADGVGEQLGQRLKAYAQQVIYVRLGAEFAKINDGEYMVNPGHPGDYDALIEALRKLNEIPQRIVHLWSTGGKVAGEFNFKDLDGTQDLGIYSLLSIVSALAKQSITDEVQIGVITDNMQGVLGNEQLCLWKATLLGAVKVIPLEYTNINCRSIDIVIPPPGPGTDRLYDLLLAELMSEASEAVIALRGSHRWKQRQIPMRLEGPGKLTRRLKEQGVYLITGGLGGIGFTLAEHLAKVLKARLVLTGRSFFPPPEEWDDWLTQHTHDETDDISRKIRKIKEFEKSGAKVMVASADAADFQQMQAVVTSAAERFGPIAGVFHTVGVIDYGGVIQRRSWQMTADAMAAKVKGTLVLDELFKNSDLDFLILFSSITNVLYKDRFGQVGFVAANQFLEAFAYYKTYPGRTTRTNTCFTVTVNWSDWLEVGMTVNYFKQFYKENKEKFEAQMQAIAPFAILPPEGVAILNRVLEGSFPVVAVSPTDLGMLLRQMNSRKPQELSGSAAETVPAESYYQRPELTSTYLAPRNEVQQQLVDIFQTFLGIHPVGIRDDFFELGGNSLTATSVISVIQKKLAKEIPLMELFNRPTIESLAEYIHTAEAYEFYPLQPLEEKEYYVLSGGQRRIYIMQQIDINSTAYNQTFVVLLEGDIDIKRLETATKKLAGRHEMLRTTFEMLDGPPVQRVHSLEQTVFAINYYETGEKEAREMVDHFVKPFDLAQLPLFRLTLIKLEETKNTHVLMLDTHHIISDGIGNNIFMRELPSLYVGENLPSLNLRYKDFAQWYQRQFNEKVMEKQKAYWLKVFSGNIPVLQLPTDYKRPTRQSFAGDILFFEITVEETEALETIAREQGATLFMVVLALYTILLSNLSGQEDIVVGTAAAGREHKDLENIIGMFVNTIALRNQVEGEMTFKEFLGRVRENTLMAFDNQNFQFDELVDKVVKQRDLSRNPIFDAMLVFMDLESSGKQPGKDGKPSPLKIKPYDFSTEATRFDLSLQEIPGPYLTFSMGYSTALFKKERIQWFIDYFKDIVAAVAADPDKKLSEISMIFEEETNLRSEFSEDLENE